MKKKSITFLKKFIHEKGRRFYAATLPEDIERGKVGDCFDHCLIEAGKSKGKYFYCEGAAFINDKWVHHAWLTDALGYQAFDPTWYAENKDKKVVPLGMVFYMGAALDSNSVMDFVVKTGYKSPFANYRKSPELAQKVYDTAH